MVVLILDAYFRKKRALDVKLFVIKVAKYEYEVNILDSIPNTRSIYFLRTAKMQQMQKLVQVID
jgi:hypothetical protein